MKAAAFRKIIGAILVAIASILGYNAAEKTMAMYNSVDSVERALSQAE